MGIEYMEKNLGESVLLSWGLERAGVLAFAPFVSPTFAMKVATRSRPNQELMYMIGANDYGGATLSNVKKFHYQRDKSPQKYLVEWEGVDHYQFFKKYIFKYVVDFFDCATKGDSSG